ncbi:Abi family protein [Halomonas getboli]|uniref:Abi family protein n=1 Tax=Halomonas getboli TaxID=2935862 RepID=UPI001FFF0FD2|nr:Abi family protein [Halomonas getboli]MCK2183592.1 Abi family protein [Halomonas getboli]
MTRFAKPALTAREQLDLLIERGLQVENAERALRLLEVTTLFRLSPYMRPFQFPEDSEHAFKPGSRLADIVRVYRFDSDLRQLLMTALERVEIAVRACISHHMAPAYGAHWYLDRQQFVHHYRFGRMIGDIENTLASERKKFQREQQQIQKSRVSDEIKRQRIESRKRDNYPRFYAETYSDPCLPPSWAALEEMSLGSISHLYQGLARDRDRKAIATRFGLHQKVLGSWLHTLTFVRNICAHHARLWNRELGIPPRWDDNISTPDGRPGRDVPRRLFTVLAMLTYLTTQISPDTRWPGRLQTLLAEYPDIPRQPMGFPDDWQQRLASLHTQPPATAGKAKTR